MAKNFNSSALPEHCYAVLPGSGQLIEVRRGEKGYYPCAYSTGDREYNKVLANQFNAHEGISKAQAAACLLYTSPSPRDRTRSRMPSSA